MTYTTNNNDQRIDDQGGLKIIEEGGSIRENDEHYLTPHSEIYSDFLIMFRHLNTSEIINYFKTTPAEELSGFEYGVAQQVLLEKFLTILKEKTKPKSSRLERKFEPTLDI